MSCGCDSHSVKTRDVQWEHSGGQKWEHRQKWEHSGGHRNGKARCPVRIGNRWWLFEGGLNMVRVAVDHSVELIVVSVLAGARIQGFDVEVNGQSKQRGLVSWKSPLTDDGWQIAA